MPVTAWSGVWRWGDFQVDPAARELRRANQRVTIQDQPLEVLTALLERAGREVTRDELFARLWPQGTFVDRESGLNTAVKKLRNVLGDDAQAPRFIETRARHGYRFIARLDSVATPPMVEGAPPPAAASRRPSLWLVGAAVLLVAALGSLAWERKRLAGLDGERAVLVVLPFENLSGDPDQEYFSDGMTDEMISRLGQLRAGRVDVLGGATSRHYKESGKEAEEFARELGADYTLAGSVRREAGRVRITAELVRSRDHRLLWSESYDGEMRDVLDLQRQVAESIAGRLPALGDRRPLPASRPVDPAAYEAFLRGRFFWDKVSAPNERKAIGYFEEAVRLDPSFAPAWAWQGSAYQMLGNIGEIRPAEVLEKAWPLVQRAVELDPDSADAQSCFGWTSLLYRWDFAGAERAFERALEINPDFANARHGLATHRTIMGRLDEALREMERAHASDPLALVTDADVGYTLYLAGRDAEALLWLRKTLELDPDYAPAHYFMSLAYRDLRKDDEAFAEQIRAATLINGGEPPWLDKQRQVFAEGGWLAWRRDIVESAKGDPIIGEYVALLIAESYLDLGSNNEALDWLEKAYVARPYQITYLAVDPVWEPLRGEPRFQELLRKIGLPRVESVKTAAAN
jgi:TolB-like protein/DNA-binding winged helix-turn-helix (wHTH) protein/Tfp pilus assembly protein PilF